MEDCLAETFRGFETSVLQNGDQEIKDGKHDLLVKLLMGGGQKRKPFDIHMKTSVLTCSNTGFLLVAKVVICSSLVIPVTECWGSACLLPCTHRFYFGDLLHAGNTQQAHESSHLADGLPPL